MSSNCVFELNRSPAIYFGGEIISGKITLNNSGDKNVRDVSIILLGEGKVKWSETHSTGNTTNTTFHISHEIYINNKTLVHGNGILSAGQYNWNFNIFLPEECPTSMEGKYGYIRYEIILKINRYYRFDNVYKKRVNVIKNIDLNLNPTYKIPVSVEFIKTLCCWPCQSGKILISLILPFGAYTPGQLIRYSLHIQNNSMSDIEGYCLELCKEIIFTAISPQMRQRSTKDIINKVSSLETCLKLSNRVIDGFIYTPDTPSTTKDYDIIFIKYNLKVTLRLSGCSRNPVLSVPIIIGTIPLRESLTDNQITSTLTNRTQQELLSQVATDIIAEAQNFNDDSPPSYNHIDPMFCDNDSRFSDTDNETQNLIVSSCKEEDNMCTSK